MYGSMLIYYWLSGI